MTTTIERLRDAAATAATLKDAALAELGEYGALVDGQWLKTGDAIEVRSPYDESLVAVVHRAGANEIEQAIGVNREEVLRLARVREPRRQDRLKHGSDRDVHC